MSDVTFLLHGHKINLRVGAVVRRGTDVLFCRNARETWWYLPGGRLKAGESSADGLVRELREEIGAEFEVMRLSVCGENFFTHHGATFHEVCFYYEVSWKGGALRPEGADEGEVFAWMPAATVAGLDLRPSFMKPHVAVPPATLQHVIHREER